MNDPKQVREARTSYATSTNKAQTASVVNLGSPIILERDGQPMAVLMSIQEYERYQSLLEQHQKVSAHEARRAADRAVFGDLVGCALSSGDPVWTPTPEPRWRIPYRLFDGTLLAVVEVDARTQAVLLTEERRTALLEQVERSVMTKDVSA
jgi:PHD/YefM family antitoxin component YafN of YafNO toxin-antitoxin module